MFERSYHARRNPDAKRYHQGKQTEREGDGKGGEDNLVHTASLVAVGVPEVPLGEEAFSS